MRVRRIPNWWFLVLIVGGAAAVCAQDRIAGKAAELRLHLVSFHGENRRAVPAVIWLEPLPGTADLPFTPQGHYTLLQKNRTFIPHLQVIPVGSVVQFPNKDPFFHNVFSYFDGKRFDLGLYEAGSTKSVTFSREGVSYIFCNIHPEMSAVVVALSTPLYAIADAKDAFVLRNIPEGKYRLHVWIEGVQPSALDGLSRDVHFSAGRLDLGDVTAPMPPAKPVPHTNKFGEAYAPDPASTY
jgi:hypothetical protein